MNFNKKDTIAVIDSGVGGVSVLNKIIKKYKVGDYIYYADNEYMPYGNKTSQQITERIEFIIDYLRTIYGANKFVIACNTASACINPKENVFCMTFNKKDCYLATTLTKKILNKPNIIADKSLASEIENNILNKDRLSAIIIDHVNKNKLYLYKNIILACTHYELAEDLFKKFLPLAHISCNSNTIVNKLQLKVGNTLNIALIMSKYSKSFYDKFYKIVAKI